MRSVDKGSFINKLREQGFDTSYAEADPLTAPANAGQQGGGGRRSRVGRRSAGEARGEL